MENQLFAETRVCDVLGVLDSKNNSQNFHHDLFHSSLSRYTVYLKTLYSIYCVKPFSKMFKMPSKGLHKGRIFVTKQFGHHQ